MVVVVGDVTLARLLERMQGLICVSLTSFPMTIFRRNVPTNTKNFSFFEEATTPKLLLGRWRFLEQQHFNRYSPLRCWRIGTAAEDWDALLNSSWDS